MNRTIPLVLLPFVALACDDSPTTVETEPPPASVLASLATLSVGPSGTTPCPEGGQLTREMSIDQTVDGAIVTTTWHMTLVQDNCGVRIDPGTVLMSDGQLTIDGLDRREVDNEAGTSRLLESTSRQVGSIHWYGDGYDRTCAIDVTLTTDPGPMTLHMNGSICGQAVDYEFTPPALN